MGQGREKKQIILNRKDAVSVLIQLIEEEKLDLANIFSETAEKISPKKNAPRVFSSSVNDEHSIDEIKALEKFNNIRKNLLLIDPLPQHHSKFAEDLLTKALEETLETYPKAHDIITAILEDPKLAFSVENKNIVNEFIKKLNVKTPVEQYNQLLTRLPTFHWPLIDTASNTGFAKEALNTLLSNTNKKIDELTAEDLENLALHQNIETLNTLIKNLFRYLEAYREHDGKNAQYNIFQYSNFLETNFENTAENDQRALTLLTEIAKKIDDSYGELASDVFEQIVNGTLPPPESDDQLKEKRRGILEILSKQFSSPEKTRISKPDLYTNFLSNFLAKYKYATQDEEVDLLKHFSQKIAAGHTKQEFEEYLDNASGSTENLFIAMMKELKRIRFVDNEEGEPRLELNPSDPIEEEDILEPQVAANSEATSSAIEYDSEDDTQKQNLRIQKIKSNQSDEMKETSSFEDSQTESERSRVFTKDKLPPPGERIKFEDEQEQRNVFANIQATIQQIRQKKAAQQSQAQTYQHLPSTESKEDRIEEYSSYNESNSLDAQPWMSNIRNLGQELPDDFLTRPQKHYDFLTRPQKHFESLKQELEEADNTDTEEVEIKPELGQSEEHPAPKVESTFRALYNHIYLYVFEFLPKPHTKEIEILKELISACREESKKPDLMKQNLDQLDFYKEKINKTGFFDPSEMKDLEKLKELILKEAQNYLPKKEVSKSSWRTFHLWKWKEKVTDKTTPSKVAGLISIIHSMNGANLAEETLTETEWFAFKFLKFIPKLLEELKETESKIIKEDQAQAQLLLIFQAQLLLIFKDFLKQIWKIKLMPLRDENPNDYEKRLQIQADAFVENIKEQLPSNRIIYLRHISMQLLQSLEMIYAMTYDEAHPNKDLFSKLKQNILAIDDRVINASASGAEIVAQLQDAMKQLGHAITVELNSEENDINPIKLKRNSTEDRRLRVLTTATYLLQNVNDLLENNSHLTDQLKPLKQIVQQNMRAILALKLPEEKEQFNLLLMTITNNAIELNKKFSSVLKNASVSFPPNSPLSVLSNSEAKSILVKQQEASVNDIKSIPPTTPPSPTRK